MTKHSMTRNIQRWNKLFVLALVLVGSASYAREETDSRSGIPPHVDRATYRTSVRPVFQKFCVRCHGENKQEAGLRLDNAELDFAKRNVATKWTEIMDRINSGEMPPADQPQPSGEQLTRVVEWITGELRRREAAIRSTGGRVVMRRMNRAEYNNTIRDLVSIDFQPADDFPADPPAFGFDNIGAAQDVSPLQIEKYVVAARRILDRAIVTGPRPKSVRWRIDAAGTMPRYDLQEGWDGEQVKVHVSANDKVEVRGRTLMIKPPSGFIVLTNINFRAGEYIIRARAAGKTPSRKEVVTFGVERNSPRTDPHKQMRDHFRRELMFQFGPPRLRILGQADMRFISEIDVDVPLDQPKVYELRTRFGNETSGVYVRNVYNIPYTLAIHGVGGTNGGIPLPNLFLDWIEIEGPVFDSWPPRSHERILFASENGRETLAYVREVLHRFMSSAWRRPVTHEEVDRKLQLFKRVRPQKPNFDEAIKVPLIAILSSPHFLYLAEPDDRSRIGRKSANSEPRILATSATKTSLDNYELASRLSYFLWSSMPDKELFTLAQQNRLIDAATLRKQVDRMLADTKSNELTKNFAGQWLGLREVGVTPPSGVYFRRYDNHLRDSMVRESEAFFAEILHKNLPATNFIQSNFVTVNERLARFYGIENVRGDHMRRVPVPEGLHRGGVLTQASVLTTTSNGTRTSPVKRGKWILENILGDPPPPPPPDAGEIPQKVPGVGKVTVRKRLELHRQLPACAACHNKIDPLGLALEQFRGDGSWAEQEANGWHGWIDTNDPPIDPAARMPDGREIKGVDGLQRALLQQEDKFLRCLAEKLATYALGRGMEYSDREWLESLVVNMQSNGKTLRGLIKDIVASEQFRMK